MLTYQETSEVAQPSYSPGEEEVLIDDNRANLGPAELVEHKLSTLLGGAWLPVSHIRIQPLQGSRNHC